MKSSEGQHVLIMLELDTATLSSSRAARRLSECGSVDDGSREAADA